MVLDVAGAAVHYQYLFCITGGKPTEEDHKGRVNFFYNCKSEHKDTTSQYVAKPLRMLGLHTNSKSEISSLPMDLLWRSETQKSKHTAFKTDRWM